MSLAEAPDRARRVRHLGLWAAMVAIGIGWGLTQLLSKIGMGAGYHPLGVTFWQAAIGAVVALVALALTGRRLPFSRFHLAFYAACGLLGTALPATLSFTAIQHLPVGVQSIVLATVPMMTLLLALPLGLERAEPRRLIGLVLGLTAVLVLVGPDASLPHPGQAAWIALPVIVALSYASENVLIDRYRPAGMDALQIGCGLFLAAFAMMVPMLAVPGIVPFPATPGPQDLALLACGILNIASYLGLVWLIGRGGSVFASQVGYIVTGTGVLAGMLALGEQHSAHVWAALALLFTGLALVTPRETASPMP